MPKVWLRYEHDWQEWEMLDQAPDPELGDEVVAIEMNGSLYRQIRAAEKKVAKFQELLGRFFVEGQQHPNTVRRVR